MANFAKRHYEAIAEILRVTNGCSCNADTEPLNPLDVISWVESEMADMLARDNPRFDRARFLAACKPGADVRARRAA